MFLYFHDNAKIKYPYVVMKKIEDWVFFTAKVFYHRVSRGLHRENREKVLPQRRGDFAKSAKGFL